MANTHVTMDGFPMCQRIKSATTLITAHPKINALKALVIASLPGNVLSSSRRLAQLLTHAFAQAFALDVVVDTVANPPIDTRDAGSAHVIKIRRRDYPNSFTDVSPETHLSILLRH
jgi:hypothetical protein